MAKPKKKASRKDKALDPKHERQNRFIDEYLKDLNGTQAAIRAGYSEKCARQHASDLLAKPDIQERIAQRRAELEAESGITVEKVLAEYAKLAFLDPRLFFGEDGALLPIHKLPPGVAAALQGFEFDQIATGQGKDRKVIGQTAKIKLINKKEALDSIARILGMFKDSLIVKTDPIAALLDDIDGKSTGLPAAQRKPE